MIFAVSLQQLIHSCATIFATLTHSDGPVVSNGCNRSQTRTFTATDGCGNTATKSITATWIVDRTPPSFTGSYTDVDLGCNPANPNGALGSASATDGCGAVTITSSDGAVASQDVTVQEQEHSLQETVVAIQLQHPVP